MNLFEAIKKNASSIIQSKMLELHSITKVDTVNKDTNEVTHNIKVECNIAKKSGIFSHCVITVKIPNCTNVKVSTEALEENDYLVFFKDLEISYIDSRGNVYFKATDYDIEKEE